MVEVGQGERSRAPRPRGGAGVGAAGVERQHLDGGAQVAQWRPLLGALAGVGVMTAPLGRRALRFVTSLEVDADGVRAALSAAGPVLR